MCDSSKRSLKCAARPCSSGRALRSDWRFGAFVHFCRLFADALQLVSFPAERLEHAILVPSEQTVFLQELLIALLGAKADWQNSLASKLKRQWRDFFAETGNPLENVTFFELEPLQRVSP